MNKCGAELYKQRAGLEDSLWKEKAVILLKHTSSCQAMETQKSGNLFHLISHSSTNDCFIFLHCNAFDEKNSRTSTLSHLVAI